ncbi:CGNR zinc finger domain-containing protein [Sinomonas susongensis]
MCRLLFLDRSPAGHGQFCSRRCGWLQAGVGRVTSGCSSAPASPP